MSKTSVIIPAYNEELKISQTITALKELHLDNIIVVDDASTDKTVNLADEAGADKIVKILNNKGKGNALNQGIACLDQDTSIVLFIDADLGETAVEAGKLLQPIINKKADMTIAVFPKAKKKGGFGLVKSLARNSVKFLGGVDVSSPLSGQRALTRELVDSTFPLDVGYGIEVGLTIDAARKGFRITEVPVQMTHNETGRDLSGFIHRGKQFWQISRTVVRKIFVR